MSRVFIVMALGAALSGSAIAAAQADWPAGFTPEAQDEFVPPGTKFELLWGEGEFTEGPTLAMGNSIMFSDIGDTIYIYHPQTNRVDAYFHPSGRANGLAFSPDGCLVACEGANTGGNRCISKTGPVTTPAFQVKRTLADQFDGKRFNSPNDLAIDQQGRVYFTDPRYVGSEPRALDFEGVFLVAPDGSVKVATRDVEKPNGILVAPDGKTVYIADNNSAAGGKKQLTAFAVGADGTLADKRVLHTFQPQQRGIDGMAIDRAGNIYATAGQGSDSGIYVFSPDGRPLAFAAVPGTPTNCDFGGGDESATLYVTASVPGTRHPATGNEKYGLYRARLKHPGYHVYEPQP
ncbi:MAG: SMP-30/gluconolactonase/LRE family protein [Pirellulales bacterium]|nr:SMP-30/gluconolactonase/LRE family protein [Pirellulales bacterium]